MGAGMGAGAAIGNIMGQVFGGGFQQNPNTISLSHSLRCSLRSRVWCVLRVKPVCPPGQNSVQTAASLLWKRRTGVLNAIMRSAKEPKFCPECGEKQEVVCNNCGAKLSPGTKFCSECGTKVE